MKRITSKTKISLVIGSIYSDLHKLKILLSKLDENLNYLDEIICVISDINSLKKIEEVSKLKEIIDIEIDIICKEEIVFPGESRNIGIRKSNSKYICFLDSHTLPDKNWIANSIKILKEKNLRGCLGKTKFIPTNEFEDCFISATYGNIPLTCIPGTIIEKNLLKEIGFFVPNNRSGEDAELINRSRKFYSDLFQSNVIPCKYVGLKGNNSFDLYKKWYQYSSATINPRFYSQRILYFTFTFTFTFLLAFSWNDKVANWDQSSFFYVPHISKMFVTFIILGYLIYRMIFLPTRKKVKLLNFKIIKFTKFCFISLILDLRLLLIVKIYLKIW